MNCVKINNNIIFGINAIWYYWFYGTYCFNIFLLVKVQNLPTITRGQSFSKTGIIGSKYTANDLYYCLKLFEDGRVACDPELLETTPTVVVTDRCMHLVSLINKRLMLDNGWYVISFQVNVRVSSYNNIYPESKLDSKTMVKGKIRQ